MLGRFLHSLNEYCEEERGKRYDISDYDEYNFHKVAPLWVICFPSAHEERTNHSSSGVDLGMLKR